MSAPRWNVEQRGLFGVVKWFSPKLLYGFIVPDEGGEDHFMHLTNVLDDYIPTQNDQVQYDLARAVGERKNKKGPVAINVKKYA